MSMTPMVQIRFNMLWKVRDRQEIDGQRNGAQQGGMHPGQG